MAAIGEDFHDYLLADPGISTAVGAERVHQNNPPETYGGAFVFYTRRGIDQAERTVDQAKGQQPFRQLFDVECVSADVDEANDLAELVRALDCDRGTFGTGTIQAVYVDDQTDDYEPRAFVAGDQRLHNCALLVELVGHTPAP